MQKNANRPGYKKTKIGWIPEDWGLSKACDLMDVRDGTHDTPQQCPVGVPLVTQKNIVHGRLDKSDCYCIAEQDADLINKRSSVAIGDILISMIGTVGESALVETTPDFCIKNVGLFKSNDEQIMNRYMIKYFHSTISRRVVRQASNGGIQKFISLTGLRQLPIPLPPLPEQEAIAGVLECWDKAIRGYEKKIEKKRNIKKGLMQALLSGKIRLPGFGTTEDTEGHGKGRGGIPEGWKEERLGELGKTYSGLTGKSKDDFGAGKSFIPYMNIYSNALVDSDAMEHVDIKPGENQNRSQYGDLFFTTSSETPEEVGTSSILLHDVDELYLNSFCFGFRLHDFETLRPEFSRHYFRGMGFRKAMFRIAQGASRYNLSKKYFLQTLIQIPGDIEEQEEIARILSAQASEISTLESKLMALRDQKRFLLNNLVTGSLRLPEFATTENTESHGNEKHE